MVLSQKTSGIVVVGINHKNSTIDLREKFFLSPAERQLLLSELKSRPEVLAAFVISTCNRTEIYAHLLSGSAKVLLQNLFSIKKQELSLDLTTHFYTHEDQEAVRHLFSVTAGLDSLVLGEKQILGQVKEAIDLARAQGTMNRELNILSHLAVRVGKKARTETEIGCGGSSISWAAVTRTQEKLGTLAAKSILIIGAGKMGQLAVEQLKNKNIGTVYVMNRNCDKAENLAKGIGTAVSFWEMKEILTQVDACICSSGAPHYVIEKELMVSVMANRNQHKMLLIDISMPRNIDPETGSIPGVELLTIDELDLVVEDNVRRRKNSIGLVNEIIHTKINEFYTKIEKAERFLENPIHVG